MINTELRRMTIGGGDIAAIFGCDDRKDAFQVWARKKGGDEYDVEQSFRMMMGKALEQGIVTIYNFVTGRAAVYYDETVIHHSRPWMAGTPDALIPSERRGLECKLIAWDQRRNWGWEAHEIPQRTILQVWWYMALMDYDVWDVTALIGENQPRIYTFERDHEAERVMLARAEEWHHKYLAGNERPPIGGSDTATRWLQQVFSTHKRPDLRDATEEEIAMLDRSAIIRNEVRKLTDERRVLDNQLRERIGGREGITCEHATYTWRTAKQGVIAWKELSGHLLDEYVQDPATRTTLPETFRRAAGRRSRLTHDLLKGGSDDE
jgi:predicted phage-related endonuclease